MLDVAPCVIFLLLLIHVDLMSSADLIQACVFNTEARHRTGQAKFTVQDIDYTLCTHYIYDHASIDPSRQAVIALDPTTELDSQGLYQQFNNGKKAHPTIKTLLTVGGPETTHSSTFHGLFRTEVDVHLFAYNAITFLRLYSFDGINMYWLVDSTGSDKTNYTRLLRALRIAFNRDDQSPCLLLTMAGQAHITNIDTPYDVREVARLVDYVFVMAYMYTSASDEFALFSGPLFNKPHPNIRPWANVNVSINNWWALSMPYEKMVLGVSARANFVKLANPKTDRHPGARKTADVLLGRLYTFEGGLAYPEVCDKFPTAIKYYDSVQMSPYLVNSYEWVGYEDAVSLQEKVRFVQYKHLAGIMFSNMDEDDFKGKSCKSGRYPLISHIKRLLNPEPTTTTTTTTTKQTTTTARQTETTSSTEVESTTEPAALTAPETIPYTTIIETWPDPGPGGPDGITTDYTDDLPTTEASKEHETDINKYILIGLLYVLGYGMGCLCMIWLRAKCSKSDNSDSD